MRIKNKPKATFSQPPLIQQIRGITDRGSSPESSVPARKLLQQALHRPQVSSGHTYMLLHLVMYRPLHGSLLCHGPPGASLGQPTSPWHASRVIEESAPGTTPPPPSLPLVSVGLFHIFSLLSSPVVQPFFPVSYIRYYRGANTFADQLSFGQQKVILGTRRNQSGVLSQQPSLHFPFTHLLAKQQGCCSIQISMRLCRSLCSVQIFLFLFPFPYLLYRKQSKTKSLRWAF